MRALRLLSGFVLLALATASIGPAGALARPVALAPAVRAAAAPAAGSKAARGASAVCRKRARSRAHRIASRAGSGTATASRAHRVGKKLRRRCLIRLRRLAARRGNAQRGPASPGNAHLVIGIDGGYGGWWSEEIELRTALDAAVTRHEWDPAQPVDAQDGLVLAAASQVHTRIHALLGANSLGDPTHYREWVVAFIRRYGAGGSFWSEHPELDASRYAITTFELGNEPYFGTMTATEYADTVRPTLEEVARLGLPAKIVLPDWTYGTDTSWMDTLYQRIPNLNSLFYAFAEHPYWYGHDPAESGPAGPFERIGELRRRMDEHGASSKPIFITEYGESTANCGSQCVSESVQAEHLKEMIDAVVSRPEWGVEMLSIFQLHDWATNSTDREKQFGILRQDGTPKPAYPIVSAAMQQYRG
jgi:hypothetical protein